MLKDEDYRPWLQDDFYGAGGTLCVACEGKLAIRIAGVVHHASIQARLSLLASSDQAG